MFNGMNTKQRCGAAVMLMWMGCAGAAAAQDVRAQPAARPQQAQRGLGLDVFGGGSIGWPTADRSFEVAGLRSNPLDFGGGARVTGLWKKLFAQVMVSRWNESGERAFVDASGEAFPLGIPLNVKATYMDVSLGWKEPVPGAGGGVSLWTYIAGGAGVVRYSERSPFAEPGDDLDTSTASYHALIGVEVPVFKWLAVAVDGRYRFVPNLLGDGGLSGALGEDVLGGFQTAVNLKLGFGGGAARIPARPAPPPAPQPAPDAVRRQEPGAVILESAPVFLLPDATRTPLRTLPAGTSVRVLEEREDWIRLEFADPQFGPRVGYVQRRFVRLQ